MVRTFSDETQQKMPNLGLIQGKRDKKILNFFFFAAKLKIVSLVDIMKGPGHLAPLWPLKVGEKLIFWLWAERCGHILKTWLLQKKAYNFWTSEPI